MTEPARKALFSNRFFGFEQKCSNPPKARWVSELRRLRKNPDGCDRGGFSLAEFYAISTTGVAR
jgi:hypothetical protein